LFGLSRQSYYKREAIGKTEKEETERVVELVRKIRKRMPRIGTRKLYHILRGEFGAKGMKTGRDKLFEILRKNQLLITRRKRYTQTTNSKHWLKKYPNLIKALKIDRPDRLWVSDITYIRTDDGFCYLTMITDAYSRKIVGFSTSKTLGTEGPIEALKMAIKNRHSTGELVHHSDRGLQYCSKEYVEQLEKNKIRISMTEGSDPYENALAERMNRTIKEEFLITEKIRDYELLKKTVAESIDIYNAERPHLSWGMLYPVDVHEQTINPSRATPSWGLMKVKY
jgi:transposase InsO family protein